MDTWEGLAKSLASGETEYFAIMVTHPNSGMKTVADPKGKTFACGDRGSTSGYLIPFLYFMTQSIDPETYFKRVLYTKHRAIETRVTQGALDAGADYNRNCNCNCNAMIESGLIKAEQSKIFW